jgi:hypothetical protein
MAAIKFWETKKNPITMKVEQNLCNLTEKFYKAIEIDTSINEQRLKYYKESNKEMYLTNKLLK